jgi:hypothetical protein
MNSFRNSIKPKLSHHAGFFILLLSLNESVIAGEMLEE